MPSVKFREEYHENGNIKARSVYVSTTVFEDAINGFNEIINRVTGSENPPIYQLPETPEMKRLSGS